MKLIRFPLLPLSSVPPFLFSLLLLTACGSPFTEAPPVADSTFVSALAELHLAEARLRSQQQDAAERRSDTTTRPPLPPAVRDSILARHGTSYRPFRATLEYYVHHPEQYAELYSRIVDTLNAEQEALRFERGERPGDTPPAARPVPKAFRQDGPQD